MNNNTILNKDFALLRLTRQTDDTTTDPLPNIGELVKQLISQFVTHLFQSISRLFGN